MHEEAPPENITTARDEVIPGLIYGYVFDGKGGGRVLSQENLVDWEPSKGVRWLHFNYRNDGACEWISDRSGLNPLIIEALLADDTRPRATVVDEGLLIAFRGVNLTPGAAPDDMVSIRLWIDATQVVSTRMRSLYSVGDIARMLDDGQGPSNGAEFLVELADRLVWRMSDTVDEFEDRVAEMEEQVLATYDVSQRSELANLRRQIITLRRYLAPQREAFHKLFSEKNPLLSDADRMQLRETGDRLLRHIEDLDAVRERAALAQEELLRRISEQSNNRMYVLSIVAAIFLPLTFLTGLLGINVKGIPGADSPYAFLFFVALLVVVTTGQLLYFRRRNWL